MEIVPAVTATSQLERKAPEVPSRPKSRRKVRVLGDESESESVETEEQEVGWEDLGMGREEGETSSNRLPPPIPPRPKRRPKPAPVNSSLQPIFPARSVGDEDPAPFPQEV